MKKFWPVLGLLFALSGSLVSASAARADGADDLQRLIEKPGDSSVSTSGSVDITAAAADNDAIRITPDRTHVIRLDQDAASVIVANPQHAAIVLDSPRLLVVMPREPGSTTFTVLNTKGETLMEKSIIVASTAKPGYVRVRRICGAQDATCQSSAYYYCPDGCYEVKTVGGTDAVSQQPDMAGGAGAPAAGVDVQQMQEQLNENMEPVHPMTGGLGLTP
jgi:hypothetical protein